MPLDRPNFDEISEADLDELIEAGVPEGLVIEYKRDPYGRGDAEKKEALKDITSFANTAGGHLIVGMEESNGVAKKITGLPSVDPDALIQRLEALARSGSEPRIVGIRMRRVNLASGGCVVVVRVPRSWNPPHRVVAGGTSRFYVRNSAGAHEASVEELRVLFNLAADAQERIKKLRSERLGLIAQERSPLLQLDGAAVQIVHLVPLSAFGRLNQVDLERAYQAHMAFRPMSADGLSPRFNLDGFINKSGGDQCYSYTQIFRNGILEAAETNILGEWQNMKTFPAWEVLKSVFEAVPSYIEGLHSLDVPAPFVVMLSYLNVEGARLITGTRAIPRAIQPFPNVDPLLLPEGIIESYGATEEYILALKPALDALWNASGFPGCSYFDNEGNWIRQR